LSVDNPVSVTFKKVDWLGEHVNVQKKLRKLAQHAGHAEIMGEACFVEAIKSSTWS
jgi:class 3 adenylate cyclase